MIGLGWRLRGEMRDFVGRKSSESKREIYDVYLYALYKKEMRTSRPTANVAKSEGNH
jgi:hypothetical protein